LIKEGGSIIAASFFAVENVLAAKASVGLLILNYCFAQKASSVNLKNLFSLFSFND